MPAWSQVSDRRALHIGRVVALLTEWADTMQLSANDRTVWRDAGAWHDSLRDGDEVMLRAITGDHIRPAGLLHGPAAALRLETDGEQRIALLDAIRWHTTGNAYWEPVGRALYMADFLEPGRSFMRKDRAFLARAVPNDFDGVFRQVVRMRMEWAIGEGMSIEAETVELWNSVR